MIYYYINKCGGNNMLNKRIYKFDNLKFLLILFVVIGHFANIYCNRYESMKMVFIFIYSFSMPLFIFLSGLFQKDIKNFKGIPWEKILFYIFLILFMKISIFLIGNHFSINYSFEVFSGGEYYWYLSVIIIYILLTPLIRKVKFFYLFIFSLILALFAGYDNSINNYLYLSRLIVFFPFYILGFNFSNKKVKLLNICNKKVLKIISLIMIAIFIYICIYHLNNIYEYRMLFTGKNPYSYITNYVCTYKHRMLTYAISFVIGFSFMCITPNKKIKLISNIGKRTLQIYVLHLPIIILFDGVGFFSLLESIFDNYFVYIYLLIAVSLTFVLSISWIDKLFSYIQDNMFVYEKLN